MHWTFKSRGHQDHPADPAARIEAAQVRLAQLELAAIEMIRGMPMARHHLTERFTPLSSPRREPSASCRVGNAHNGEADVTTIHQGRS